jgi:glycosyl transferase family 25
MTPIYVINLARRPDRLAQMTRRLGDAGLGFTRIDAVDAQSAEPAWLAAHFERAGPVGPLSPAEQACALSHFRAYEHFLSSPAAAGASHAVILEDDVLLSGDAGPMLRSLDWLAKSTGLLKIEINYPGCRALLGRTRRVDGPWNALTAPLQSDHTGAGGYIISRGAAAALAAMDAKPLLMIDFLLFHPIHSPVFGRLRPEQLVPALVEPSRPHTADSDIEATRAELTRSRTKPRGLAKLRREVLRMRDQARRRAAIVLAGASWTQIDGRRG